MQDNIIGYYISIIGVSEVQRNYQGRKKCFQNNYGFKFPNFKKNNLQIEEFREFKQNKISDTPRYIITKQMKSKG